MALTPMVIRLLLVVAAILCRPCRCPAGDTPGATDIVVADFDVASLKAWTKTGTAFNSGPASGAVLAKLGIDNAQAECVASSAIEGDAPTGTLTSPPFEIRRNYFSFQIGGGDYEYSTCLNLLVGGKIVHSTTGWNSDRLAPASWDVSALRGKAAQLQIVDEATGTWGHIHVAHVVQTNQPGRLPVATQPLYGETFRPQFHFTARQWAVGRLNPGMRQEGWINDLNGLIYYDGEYHLFAQRWAKCWLHAVSRDLVHWTELQPAFWEESLDSGVQSGSCVIDYNNTSGLSPDASRPPMVAFWSRFDNHSQCISYNLDHGRTWKRYGRNPIFDHPERDPKVFWYSPGKHWVMMLYGRGQYHVLTSRNLLDWRDEHHPIDRCFECPDLFELPVDGNPDAKKWVLIQGSGQYSIGAFDGSSFKEQSPRLQCDSGPNFYATQTWANTETGDGRRIQAAWMRGGQYPDMPFNQQVTFPCRLTLRTTPGGMRLFREPVRETSLLHENPDRWAGRVLNDGASLPLEPAGDLFHIQAELTIPAQSRLTFTLRGQPLVLTSTTIQSGPSKAPVQDEVKAIEILLDRTSIEAFVNHGEISASRCILPRESGLSLKAEGGPVTIHSLTVFPLRSAWSNGP